MDDKLRRHNDRVRKAAARQPGKGLQLSFKALGYCADKDMSDDDGCTIHDMAMSGIARLSRRHGCGRSVRQLWRDLETFESDGVAIRTPGKRAGTKQAPDVIYLSFTKVAKAKVAKAKVAEVSQYSDDELAFFASLDEPPGESQSASESAKETPDFPTPPADTFGRVSYYVGRKQDRRTGLYCHCDGCVNEWGWHSLLGPFSEDPPPPATTDLKPGQHDPWCKGCDKCR